MWDMDGPIQELEAARLAAFRLIEAVQVGDTGDALATQLATAERRGWQGVIGVLLYADVVRAKDAEDPSLGEAIDRLYDHVAGVGDMAMLATALAQRAEFRYGAESAAERREGETDLARAAALLSQAEEGSAEWATAHIQCGLAYTQRELWELEEELYAAALELLSEGEERLLERVILFNRAETLLSMACAARELGETDALPALLERGNAAVQSALASPVVPSWRLELRVIRHLMDALGDVAAGEEAEDSKPSCRPRPSRGPLGGGGCWGSRRPPGRSTGATGTRPAPRPWTRSSASTTRRRRP